MSAIKYRSLSDNLLPYESLDPRVALQSAKIIAAQTLLRKQCITTVLENSAEHPYSHNSDMPVAERKMNHFEIRVVSDY